VNDGGLDLGDEGLFVGGNFQSWSPGENPMTETSEGIWETTLIIGSGSYEYNFFNGLASLTASTQLANAPKTENASLK
jgi:hypothetical protein